MKNPKAKAVKKAWDQSEAGKASAKKGNTSERMARDNKSPSGRAKKARYVRTENGKAKARQYKHDARERNPARKVLEAISASMTMMLAGNKLSSSKLEYTGFVSLDELKAHIETTWVGSMSWDNYGKPVDDPMGGWDIDHICPKSFYDHGDENEIRRCWNWRNLRAAWHLDNLKKTNSWDPILVDTVPRDYWPACKRL